MLLDVYDENCEYRVRGTSDIRSFFHNDSDNDVEFLNETITIGNPRRPLEQWADNMRNEYFRTAASNPPSTVPVLLNQSVSPQVITIDAADNERDPIVINDSDSIIIDDAIILSDDEEGGREDDNNSDNNMFAHPDLLLPSSSRRSRDAPDSLAARIYSNPSSIFGPNYLETLRPRILSPVISRSHASRDRSPVELTSYTSRRSRSPPSFDSYGTRNRSPIFANRFRRRSRSPPPLNLYRPGNRSPTLHSNAYTELDNRLNIFDGLGPLMRSRQENLYPSRNRSYRSRTTPSPPSEAVGGPSTSAATANINESDSDIEIVSHTSSNSRKRPRYDDAH
uniref:Uncharacterized protein n=1 Tax=Panagrolaimus superbus TaxID=310955 RepID=A0A914YRX5_9BILA